MVWIKHADAYIFDGVEFDEEKWNVVDKKWAFALMVNEYARMLSA